MWGTNWNGFVFEKRIVGEPSAWLGGSWSGWEAWSSSRVWFGKEIQIFDLGSGIEGKGWTLLGGKLERLIEINISQISVVSELGIFIKIGDEVKTGSLEAQLIDFGKEWKISGMVELSEVSSIAIGVGMNSDLSGHGWSLFCRKRIDNFEVTVDLKGPQFSLSCGVRRFGKMNSALFHKQGAGGGSTNWGLKW